MNALEPGRGWPLGATWDGRGVNFAVFSAHAERVELCLYDADGRIERARLPLATRGDGIWHGRLPGAGPGLVYGLRAHGPWQPAAGHRFDPTRVLLDPYAREIAGDVAGGLKARVVDDTRFDWGDDRPPHVPDDAAVLYELHVKGFTRTHPGVPEALRGSYAGLASDAAIAHLRRLGVTTLCLLPVQQHVDEARLAPLGLTNYWGYNPIGYFAVEPRLASGPAPRDEFRAMVRRLHAAGLQVVVDVVFNHTAEGDEHGLTLSFRGLDNASYYRLREDDRARYDNPSGCGNALDLTHPRVLQLVMDSLRHWVQVLHVDGFRFDLATVLAREADGAFDPNAGFLRAVAQDPVLAGVKLIAEPWDVGAGGYRLGEFPPPWLEWNDRFRDAVRRFWLGHPTTRGEFARRLAGSADVFERPGRRPAASVNYVVAHDGFTLHDLLAYAERHNEANGEGNRDGHAHEVSTNCGVEGESDDPVVVERRARLARALLSTLLLAQGTPMLAAGAELGHTQAGNNNAYCQDSAISWIDWARADQALIDHVARLIALRRRWQPLGPRWYGGSHDLAWFDADGAPLDEAAWHDAERRTLAARIDLLLLLFNGEARARSFALPSGRWQVLHDSAVDGPPAFAAGEYAVGAHAVVMLRRDQ